MDNITIAGNGANSVAQYGRNGDTEIAHVTPGEQVIPKAVQSPRLMRTVAQEFNRAGVPMSRYRVRSTKASVNPDTGKEEFFLDKVVKGVVGAAKGYVTGGIPGAVVGGLGGAFGGSGGGDGRGGASGAASGGGEANPLPQPVKFLAQIGGPDAGKYLPSGDDAARAANEELMQIDNQSNISTAENPLDALINRITSIWNEDTGYQQFADLTPEQRRATDLALRMNILKPGETATGGLLANRLKDYSAADQRAYWDAFGSVPSVAPSAPVTSSPTIKPVTPVAQQQAAAPAAQPQQAPASSIPSNEVIAGIYQAPSNAIGGTKYRVLTTAGKSYDVTMDPYTGEYKYASASDLSGYTPLTTRDGFSGGQTPSSSLKLGGANWVKPINVGQSFSAGTPAPATAAPAAPAATTPAVTTQPASTTGVSAPAAAPKEDSGYIRNDSRYQSLNNDVQRLRTELDAARNNTGGSQPTTPAAPSAPSEPLITRTSTLTPQRNQRFRSRSTRGVSARNF